MESVVNVSVVIQAVAYATPFKGDLKSINRYSLFKSLGKFPSFRLQHPLPELPSPPCHSKSPSGSMESKQLTIALLDSPTIVGSCSPVIASRVLPDGQMAERTIRRPRYQRQQIPLSTRSVIFLVQWEKESVTPQLITETETRDSRTANDQLMFL